MDPHPARHLAPLAQALLGQPPPRRLRPDHVHPLAVLGRLPRHARARPLRGARLRRLLCDEHDGPVARPRGRPRAGARPPAQVHRRARDALHHEPRRVDHPRCVSPPPPLVRAPVLTLSLPLSPSLFPSLFPPSVARSPACPLARPQSPTHPACARSTSTARRTSRHSSRPPRPPRPPSRSRPASRRRSARLRRRREKRRAPPVTRIRRCASWSHAAARRKIERLRASGFLLARRTRRGRDKRACAHDEGQHERNEEGMLQTARIDGRRREKEREEREGASGRRPSRASGATEPESRAAPTCTERDRLETLRRLRARARALPRPRRAPRPRSTRSRRL